MFIYISLLVAIVGVLVYALSANAKVQEIGRASCRERVFVGV